VFKPNKNLQKGQAILEMIFSWWLLLIVIKGLFYLFIFLWMKLWSEHNLHESIICNESQKNYLFCKRDFENNFKKGQFLFKTKDVKWKKTLKSNLATVKVQDFLGFTHTFQKKIYFVSKNQKL
jgi:hypothetical protein